MPTEYLYLATHGKHFWPKRGSAQPFISQTDARNLRILRASNQVLRRFGALVRPLYDKVDQNDKETATLAQTRDLLLPKLMSGEIRLREAEKLVEAVA
jgi:type I restriction enzyme S subunit